jgi:peptidoglycan/LPS O-acetylase OafA/YrhL
VSWEGYAVTVALVLGVGLSKLEADPVRRAIALALMVAAYCAVVFLTWGDPDADEAPGWREALWSRRTLAWLGVLLVLAAALVAAAYYGNGGGYHMPVPGLRTGSSQLR